MKREISFFIYVMVWGYWKDKMIKNFLQIHDEMQEVLYVRANCRL